MDTYLILVIVVFLITISYTLIADRGMFLCIILIGVILLYVVNLIYSQMSVVTNYVNLIKSEVNTVLDTVDVVVDNLKNLETIGKNLNFTNPLQRMPGVPSVPTVPTVPSVPSVSSVPSVPNVSAPSVSNPAISNPAMSNPATNQPSSLGNQVSPNPGVSTSPNVTGIGNRL
jgi:hypothetical protein